MVPNLFGTKDRFHGRQFFPGQGHGLGERMVRFPARHLLGRPVPDRARTSPGAWPPRGRGWDPSSEAWSFCVLAAVTSAC